MPAPRAPGPASREPGGRLPSAGSAAHTTIRTSTPSGPPRRADVPVSGGRCSPGAGRLSRENARWFGAGSAATPAGGHRPVDLTLLAALADGLTLVVQLLAARSEEHTSELQSLRQ